MSLTKLERQPVGTRLGLRSGHVDWKPASEERTASRATIFVSVAGEMVGGKQGMKAYFGYKTHV